MPPHFRNHTITHLNPLLGEAPPPYGILTENLVHAVVSAHATLGSTKASALKPLMARQDWPWLEKETGRARKTDGSDGDSTSSKVWKAVEKWDTRWKEVDERLGKLEQDCEKKAEAKCCDKKSD